MLIARRFHNDSVRDNRALRGRRLVRLLHLGGLAPMPAYFGSPNVPRPRPPPAWIWIRPARRHGWYCSTRTVGSCWCAATIPSVRTSRSGSRSAARWRRGRTCAPRRCARSGRRPVPSSRRRTARTDVAPGRGVLVQRRADALGGVVLRPRVRRRSSRTPAATPNWSSARSSACVVHAGRHPRVRRPGRNRLPERAGRAAGRGAVVAEPPPNPRSARSGEVQLLSTGYGWQLRRRPRIGCNLPRTHSGAPFTRNRKQGFP